MDVYEWTKVEYAKCIDSIGQIPIVNYDYVVIEERKIKKGDYSGIVQTKTKEQTGQKPVCS